MIEMRRAQLSFGDGLIAGEVSDLREDWMDHADRALADEQVVSAVYEALGASTSQEPQPRPAGNSGRSGASLVGSRAHPQLELCRAGALGARQSGVP
jgi:hypothetical protein